MLYEMNDDRRHFGRSWWCGYEVRGAASRIGNTMGVADGAAETALDGKHMKAVALWRSKKCRHRWPAGKNSGQCRFEMAFGIHLVSLSRGAR